MDERKNGESIKSSEKDFYGRGKDYAMTEALSELWVNSFHAPNTKKFLTQMFTHAGKPCLLVRNDGAFFPQEEMHKALTKYGCDSANTAGNQNGVGMKAAAAYFLKDQEGAFTVVVSKSKSGEYSYGLIDTKGLVYANYADFLPFDHDFTEYLKNKFLTTKEDGTPLEEGTVVCVFNTAHKEEFDLQKLETVINHEFTFGLEKVTFTLDNEGVQRTVKYEDYFREDLGNFNANHDDIRLKMKSVVFVKDNTSYCCDIECFRNMGNESVEDSATRIGNYGLVAGYENGYTPLYLGKLWLAGKNNDSHYTACRARVIAHPGAKNTTATTKDWQKLFEDWGSMNDHKIQRPIPSAKIARKQNNGSGCVAQSDWTNFKERVVDVIMDKFNEWKGNDVDYEQQERIDNLNAQLMRSKEFTADRYRVQFKFDLKTTEEKFVESSILTDPDDESKNIVLVQFNASHPYWSKMIGDKVSSQMKGMVDGLKMMIEASCHADPSRTNTIVKNACAALVRLNYQ